MAAEVGRAGATRALDVVVIVGDEEEEEEGGDVALEVVDVVTVAWEVEVVAGGGGRGSRDVVVPEGKEEVVEVVGGDAVT